uniref:Uncharacterized protein n=1 Tax=Lotus japonicus TaxID=34305 RepID=I3TA50_LOTJA|nr:unknown [Lotus japonicus]
MRKKRERASLMRGKALKEKREESRRKFWMVWTKRLKLRIGGMYKVSGTAEKATANISCSIFFFVL